MIDAIGKTRGAPNTVKTNVEQLEENLYDRLAKGGEEQHNGVIEMSVTVNRGVYENIKGTIVTVAAAAEGAAPCKHAPKLEDATTPANNDEFRFYNGSKYNQLHTGAGGHKVDPIPEFGVD